MGTSSSRSATTVEVGVIRVDVPIPLPMASHSFGEWGGQTVRRLPRGRDRGRPLSTWGTTVTSRWLDPSHNGLDLALSQTA